MAVNVRVHRNVTELHSNIKIDFHLKRSFKKQLRTDGGVIVPVSECSFSYEQPASVVMDSKAIRDAKACKKHIWNVLSGWKISSTITESLSREIVQTGLNMVMIRNAKNNDICRYTGLNLVVELEVVRVDLVEQFETSSEVVHGVVVSTSKPPSWRSEGGGGSRSTMRRRRSWRESVGVIEFKLNGGMLEKCRLCREELSSGVELIHLPNCNHVFHKTCILQWFIHHNSCPSCLKLKDLTGKVGRYAPCTRIV